MTDPFALTGRRILVTGGTRGIGRAVSLGLARAGAVVVANYVRAQAAAEELAALAGSENLPLTLCRADLTLPKGIAELVDTISGGSGTLDCLVHCAATGVHKPFAELSLRHYDWTFALNVRAFFELVQRLLPIFSPNASIVAVSSSGATRAVPAYSAVGASKGALESLARHLAVELAPKGIRVNTVSPGAIATESWEAMPDADARLAELTRRTPTGRLTAPEDVALAVQFLCSDAARAIVGHTLLVDGGAALPV